MLEHEVAEVIYIYFGRCTFFCNIYPQSLHSAESTAGGRTGEILIHDLNDEDLPNCWAVQELNVISIETRDGVAQ